MNEHVDGDTDPGISPEFKNHLPSCNPSQILVNNARRTITLCKKGNRYRTPVS